MQTNSLKFPASRSCQVLRLCVVLVTAGVSGGALAALDAVGPVNPVGDYPYWYRDSAGISLELCADPTAVNASAPANLLCRMANNEPSSPNQTETFWTRVDAGLSTRIGSAQLDMALEGDRDVASGENISYGRIHIRIDNPIAGATLKVTHPFGQVSFENVPEGQGAVNVTEKIGIPNALPPADFTGALSSNLGPFLRWADLDGEPVPVLDQLGNEYIGDPNIPHAMTGSPLNTNFFRIEGPVGLGSSNLCADPTLGDDAADLTDCIETELFAGAGRIAKDSDRDLVPDITDNCSRIVNANQRDTDADGFGNACDTDLNNDNVTNLLDARLFKTVFLCRPQANPELNSCDHADFNGDGVVNNLDAGLLKKYFLKPPG
ncbi:thrombospondin type 3 repeat-containing protein [Methylomonas sp. LL1]|uniref:dockerin type I domain-containing protein n=1 Tax=Methylomonas sp. LL1 TaxID=2785785 RepID=UPI0018C420F1|nr:dockerin type I domain-containing protein [Methylomonas sp. LL1]QPK63617.1 thrombospondin type 3 repeat-containing protein [Methylomonas sp. LL1]